MFFKHKNTLLIPSNTSRAKKCIVFRLRPMTTIIKVLLTTQLILHYCYCQFNYRLLLSRSLCTLEVTLDLSQKYM
nr:MAG TPA: hypothetical protein [Caudoviricetes sp.]